MDEKYSVLKQKSILYVEDDIALQKNTTKMLKRFFNNVYVADNGDDAYDIFEQNHLDIDLIISDIQMKEMDGIELYKYIRQMDKAIPLVIISAYTKTDYLLDSIDLNIVQYITKPFTTQKVFNLLDKLLESFDVETTISCNAHFKIEPDRSVVIYKDQEIVMGKKELRFLTILCKEKMVTYDMFTSRIWEEKVPSDNAIRIFIRKLKSKFDEDFIKNQQGVGYYIS